MPADHTRPAFAGRTTTASNERPMPGFNDGPLPAKRILVTRMKFIGDVVLTTPLLHSLRAAYPSAYIAYMAEAQACSLLQHHPAVDELIGYDFTRPSVLEQTRVALALRRCTVRHRARSLQQSAQRSADVPLRRSRARWTCPGRTRPTVYASGSRRRRPRRRRSSSTISFCAPSA